MTVYTWTTSALLLKKATWNLCHLRVLNWLAKALWYSFSFAEAVWSDTSQIDPITFSEGDYSQLSLHSATATWGGK